METFEQIIERYMKFDKKTLAELLALKEMENKQDFSYEKELLSPTKFDYDLGPNVVRPSKTAPFLPPNYGNWIITCCGC